MNSLLLTLIIITLCILIIFILYRKIYYNNIYITNYFREAKEYNVLKIDLENLILDSMEKSKFCRIKKKSTNQFNALTKISFFSWSEIIVIQYDVTENKEGFATIKFESRCLFPLQVYEYGKNKKNYLTFSRHLESKLLTIHSEQSN